MVVNCPNCGRENKNTNIKCDFCSTQLIDENKINKHDDFITNDNIVETNEITVSPKKVGCLSSVLILIFGGPWLLAGIIFLGIGLFFSISEHNQAKGYEKTIGILKDYSDCAYDDGDELCKAIYEYEVNGVIYTLSPNMSSNPDGFKESDTVYYNPNNPSESIIYANWSAFIIIGLIFVIIITIPLIKLRKLKGKDNITMKVYKTK